MKMWTNQILEALKKEQLPKSLFCVFLGEFFMVCNLLNRLLVIFISETESEFSEKEHTFSERFV